MHTPNSESNAIDFSSLNLNPKLVEVLKTQNIIHPMPVQSMAIPEALQNLDAIIVAQTGSGKTLTYLLPLISKILEDNTYRALILTPTREVADQVHQVAMGLLKDFIPETHAKVLTPCLIIGGTSNKEQVSHLKKNPCLIIATPGRLNDHLLSNKLLLQNTKCVVIDEVDRMLDMGFAPQIANIKKTLRGTWSTLMISASFANSLLTLAKSFMLTEPKILKAEKFETPVQKLSQKLIHLSRGDKNDTLIRELQTCDGKSIVFIANQPMCETISNHISENGFSSEYIHGELSPGHRDRVMREFRDNKFQVLVTTDLLARGLDVPDVECVINYDLPHDPDDFLHRIGRTARAGKKGKAITLATLRDKDILKRIKKYLVEAEEIHD